MIISKSKATKDNFPEIVAIGLIDNTKDAITCAKKDEILRNLIRVKSSNIWAYMIDVKDYKSKVGNIYTQFKGKRGQPDDIYVYYDVPVIIYRKWIGARSKGAFFWKYIRNTYKYSKLTGDKKTKLRNGV